MPTVRIKSDSVPREKNGVMTFAPAGYYAASRAVGGFTFENKQLKERFTLPLAIADECAAKHAIRTLEGTPYPAPQLVHEGKRVKFGARAA